MRLSCVEGILSGIEIIADGEFFELGLTATRSEKPMLAFLENPKYIDEFLANESIACAIVTREIAAIVRDKTAIGLAISDQPKYSFFSLHNHLVENTDFYGVLAPTVIEPGASVHPSAWVSDKGVFIGAGSTIGPHVCIYPKVRIGRNVTIGANTVIGGDGFECFKYGNDALMVKHAGSVVIGDHVDIQASCCIDKGLFGNATIIGDYCKLDNMIHVAHNVVLGRRVFIAACAMLAGRVTVGDDVWIGPAASLRNGMTVGKGAFVSIGAVATRNVDENCMVSGNFAIEHDKFLAFIKSIR